MHHLSGIKTYLVEGGQVLEVKLDGKIDGNAVYSLLMLRDRLLRRGVADVVIDTSEAVVMPLVEGVFVSLGKELAKHGKMLHLVVGDDGRPSMADLMTTFHGISFHRDLLSARTATGIYCDTAA